MPTHEITTGVRPDAILVILRSQAFSVVLIQYDNADGLLKRDLKIARIASGLTPIVN